MVKTRSDWATWLRYAGTCVGVGLLSLGASFVLYTHRARAAQAQAAAQPKPVKPLFARSTTRFYDPSGKLAWANALQYARYSDHSTAATVQELYPKAIDYLTHIVDRQAEREISFDPVTKSVITMHFSRAEQEALAAGAWEESCPVEDMANASPGACSSGTKPYTS